MARGDFRQMAIHGLKEATRVRLELGVPAHAPVDPVDLAAQCGCQVSFRNLPSLDGLYLSRKCPVIVIGSQRPIGRRTFTAAHELGHHRFGHGTSLDQLGPVQGTAQVTRSEEDQLVDRFAGFLLMPRDGILKAVQARSWDIDRLAPLQVLVLASQFGVGYTTLVDHLAFGLRLIGTDRRAKLCETKPADIKRRFDVTPNANILMADRQWADRAIDMEVGDSLITPLGVAEEKEGLLVQATSGRLVSFQACQPGVSRLVSSTDGWAAYVRVSRRWYEGHAEYRFLEDTEDD